jgi:elongation of very long chain fatty acids protein 6
MDAVLKVIDPNNHFAKYGIEGNATHLLNYKFNQVYFQYPVTAVLYSDFEKTFDPLPMLHIMQDNNYVVPVAAVLVYVSFCYFGTKIMANQKPFGLETPLALWNLFLALFSAWGSLRTVPHMFLMLSTMTFEETICENVYKAYGGGGVGFAVTLFCLSKIPELIDTVFIVLRKKPLIFLHWWHHVTVLLYCWNAYVATASNGMFFVSMNYTVHAVMYFYYFLQSVRMLPKWFPSWIITIMQISQMFVGTFIVAMATYYYYYGGEKFAPGTCNTNQSSLLAGGIIYGSYLYLFVEFALKRFVFGSGEKKKKRVPKKVE